MLQAVRSLATRWPAATAAQSAAANRLAGEYSTWQSESLPCAVSTSDDKQSNATQPALPHQHLSQMACMFNKPMLTARRGISPMATFASAPVLSVPGSRAMSTLGARPGLFMPKGLGLGLPMRSTLSPSISAGAIRSYTDGQLLGNSFMLATDIMFWSGLIGAVIFRRNLIVMLLATEIVMLACNLNFLFASAYLNDMTGVIMSITITTIAACETAIGLALCVTYFHLRSQTDVEALNFLK
mmetsp:Transcript_29388/g.74939  ORF Transcript_29388/g.74939 Transcript_29388/m.74939 type:complete len:241 (-) Transcript_29388:242-964(-)